MLHLLDESLEAFLRLGVPLPAQDVDVSFDAPDRDWGAGITRPTVNLFLWDVRRNLAEQDAGWELHKTPEGRAVRRTPPPRLDCRYLVTAWTSEARDEHALLGDVLCTCLLTSELQPELLSPRLAAVRPLPSLRVARPDGKDTADFWSAIGGQLKPGLDLVVTMTVDAVPSWDAGGDIDRYELTATAVSGGHADARKAPVWLRERRVWVRSGDADQSSASGGQGIVGPGTVLGRRRGGPGKDTSPRRRADAPDRSGQS